MDKANPPPPLLLRSTNHTPARQRWENRTEGKTDRGGSGGRMEGKKDTKREKEKKNPESCGEWSDRDRELCKCTTL